MESRTEYVHLVNTQMIVGASDTLAAVAGEDIRATSHPQYTERE